METIIYEITEQQLVNAYRKWDKEVLAADPSTLMELTEKGVEFKQADQLLKHLGLK